MIKHTKIGSAPSDGTSGVQGSDWNADHTIDDAAGLSSTLGIYVTAGNPNGTLSGALGELARDTVNGQLWECVGGTSWTALVRADGGTTGVKLDGLSLTNNTSPSVGPEMDYIGYNGNWVSGIDVANSPTSRDFVITGVRGSYSLPDGATTSGSPTLTSPSGGGFTSALVGASISGSDIPNGTTIIAVGGTTSLTMSANATTTASGVRVTITRNTTQDLAYWKHRGAGSPTLGIGVTPPDGSARLQVSAHDDEPAMGAMRVRVGPAQTGKAFTVHDSNPIDRLWVDSGFFLSGLNPTWGAAVSIQAEPSANGKALTVSDNTKALTYGFSLPTGSGNVLRIDCTTTATNIIDFGTDGSLRHLSAKLGFFGASTTTKPTVTGSRGGNAALASLLTALQTLGLITDSTTE